MKVKEGERIITMSITEKEEETEEAVEADAQAPAEAVITEE